MRARAARPVAQPAPPDTRAVPQNAFWSLYSLADEGRGITLQTISNPVFAVRAALAASRRPRAHECALPGRTRSASTVSTCAFCHSLLLRVGCDSR
jgi:hypothetical protein